MKLKLTAAAFAVCAALSALGQDSATLLRKPYTLKVAVDKQRTYEEDIPARPYVLPNNAVQLYPGETVFIEIEQENGVVKKVTAVEKPVHPEKTVTISFTQTARKKVHQMITLSVSNPFSKSLVYSCTMFLLQQQRWVSTNVLPVPAQLSGYETWPDVIVSMALGDWKLTN